MHTRSQSSDPHRSVSDRDAVVRSPQPGLLRDRAAAMPLDLAGPTLPARRPMTPQSPAPPPSSTSSPLSGEVYHNGVTNAAFIHPDPARVEPCATSRRVAGVYRPSSSSHRTPQNSSVYAGATSNGFGRSPVIPRRRDVDVDVDDGRRSVTGSVGSRAREDEYVHSHPPPPPPPAPSVPAAGVMRRQNTAASIDSTASHHPASLRGPLSLSTGVLNFSPPAPHLIPVQVRASFSLSL